MPKAIQAELDILTPKKTTDLIKGELYNLNDLRRLFSANEKPVKGSAQIKFYSGTEVFYFEPLKESKNTVEYKGSYPN